MPIGSNSEHRAMAWAAIGAALVAVGGVSCGTLATIGASLHLWGDNVFLAGFAGACALTGLGIYVIVAEFIGQIGSLRLWLPPTRREREDKRRAEGPALRLSVPKGRIPSPLVPPMRTSDPEAARINASEDPRFAQYREMPTAKASRSIQDQRREAARRALRSTPQERKMRELYQQVQALSEEGDQRPVPDAHRDELKELAVEYSKAIAYHRAASGKQNERHERSFWTHFPVAGRALEACDRMLAQRESARAKMSDWLKREDPTRGSMLVGHIEAGSDPSWHVDAGCLFMDGGWGVVQVTDETNVEAIKRPYADLLARARATPEAGLLRTTVDGHNTAIQVAEDELRRIQMLHVIRGKCELC